MNTGQAHTARKDVYQRTILPNLPRKILSPMNPLAVYLLGESGAVEIQASPDGHIAYEAFANAVSGRAPS